MNDKKHLASITILVKDRQSHASDVNRLLSEKGHFIYARMGVNVQKSCIDHCTGIITVIVEATSSEISSFTKELNDLYGIVAKANVMTE